MPEVGGRLCPPYYYWPPIFLDDAASLTVTFFIFDIINEEIEIHINFVMNHYHTIYDKQNQRNYFLLTI